MSDFIEIEHLKGKFSVNRDLVPIIGRPFKKEYTPSFFGRLLFKEKSYTRWLVCFETSHTVHTLTFKTELEATKVYDSIVC